MNSLSRLAIAIFVAILLTVPLVSATREDATEHTAIVDGGDTKINSLWTENGKDVIVWIDSIDGLEGNSSHPIDVYIATSDQWWDHMCAGDDSMFSDPFNPVFYKESLSPSDTPFSFTYSVTSDDSFYLIIDNCDNQRTTDYNADESSVSVTYAIDDESDEFADDLGDAAAGLGIVMIGGIALCCGLPFLIIVVLLVRKNKTQVVVQAQPQGIAPQGFPAQQNVAYAPPTQVTPPLQQNPPAHMQGVSDANGYEWLDYQGNKYWRQQNSKSDWTLHQ